MILWKIQRFQTLASTNATAMALNTDESMHGTVVIAETQTAGRGRMTRIWHSPAGRNLYVSLLLYPHVRPDALPQLALITAIALHKTLTDIIPTESFGLKWPNDVWSAKGKKLSGILCEARFCGNTASVVIGIGINVNGHASDFPQNLQNKAGTLEDIAKHTLDRNQLLKYLLDNFQQLFEQWQTRQSLEFLQDYWKQYDILAGKDITICQQDESIAGQAVGIQNDGQLLLKLPSGTLLPIPAGDTHISQINSQN